MKSILQSAKWMSYIYRCNGRRRSCKEWREHLAKEKARQDAQDLEDYRTFCDAQPTNEVIIQRLTRRYKRLQSQLEAIRTIKKLLDE